MKKGFKRLGMLVSVVIIIVGICVLSGAFSGSASYPTDALATYDSGYAMFGADFYSYVCNNSAEAASAARATSNNVIDVADNITVIGGIIIIALGALGFCFFGMMPTGAFTVAPLVAVASAAPAVPEEPVVAEEPEKKEEQNTQEEEKEETAE